jgi:hydroxymethylpyrimidine/phosphomethylpyrimidine kinase
VKLSKSRDEAECSNRSRPPNALVPICEEKDKDENDCRMDSVCQRSSNWGFRTHVNPNKLLLMPEHKSIPCVVTVAGSDSGGGAGIQADLKTFDALGVHGASVITCVTAQNPKRVLAVEACSPSIVKRQLEAVFEELHPAAAKTGMLYSAETIRAVARFFQRRRVPLVLDPVMVATSGSRLLKRAATVVLCEELLPLAALVTPNLPEAEVLTGEHLASVEDLRRAARTLHRRFACAALIKGGHLRGLQQAVDIFYDGADELLLTAPFIRGVNTHGTGCTYSAAIAAGLGRGFSLARSVQLAKEFITQAIAHSQSAAGHSVLDSGWRFRRVTGGRKSELREPHILPRTW